MRIIYILLLAGFFFLIPQGGSALSLRQVSDVVTRLKINTLSNHTIQFTMSGGMMNGILQVDFSEAVGSTNDISYQDIDFAYGQPGFEREQVLLGEPSTNIWGVTINSGSKIIAFTFPTANGTPLVSGDRGILKIGNHALFGKPANHALRQMINNETEGSKQITIIAGTDSGALAIPLLSEDSIGVTGDLLKLELTATSSSKVLVTLFGGTRAATGYRIERSLTGSSYQSIAEIPQTKREYEDKNLQPNTTYYYRIVPYNESGILGVADQAIITTPQAGTLTTNTTSSPPTSSSTPTITSPVSTPPVSSSYEVKPSPTQVPVPSQTPEPNIISQILPNISALRFERLQNGATFFWQNPKDMKGREIIVRRSEKIFPRQTTEGTQEYQGGAEQFSEQALSPGTTYYYTFFVADTKGKFSSGSFISLTIPSLPILSQPKTVEEQPQKTPSVQEEQPLVIQLASPIKQVIQPSTARTFMVKNTDSGGGEQTLRVDIPKNLSDKPFDLTIVPIAKTQSYLFDKEIRFPDNKEVLGNLFDVNARQNGKPLKKFTKTIRLTFNYNEKLFKNIAPEKIKVYFWDPLTEEWVVLANTYVDTQEKLVVVEVDVDHFTLFTVMADKEGVQQEEPIQKVTVEQDISPDIARELKQENFELKLESITFTYAGTLQTLVQNKKGWYAVRGEYVNICIPYQALSHTSEYVSLKLFSNEFFLTDDPLKKCYTATVTIPEQTGEYEGLFKVVASNDRITKTPFTLTVTTPAQEALMVYGEQLFKEPLANPATVLAFISMLLMLIGGGWYVVRRKSFGYLK